MYFCNPKFNSGISLSLIKVYFPGFEYRFFIGKHLHTEWIDNEIEVVLII